MGNTLLDDQRKDDPVENFDKWLEQNPSLIDKFLLAENKSFRVSSFLRNHRKIVIKTYFRRETQTSLKEYFKSFQIIQQLVQQLNCSHIIPLRLIDTRDPNPIFYSACRQFLYSTLESRLQARPSLDLESKRWIIFQMILAVYTIHKDFNLYHGNIRTSNFLITTYEYLSVTDLASYKPMYISQGNEKGLSEFRVFYGSSVDKCTFAPQKLTGDTQTITEPQISPIKLFQIYTKHTLQKELPEEKNRYSLNKSTKQSSNQNIGMDLTVIEYNENISKLKSMDVFSLGCCILEVLNNGKAVLTYQKLLKLKKGEYQLKPIVQQITENLPRGDKIRELILEMINTRPTARVEIGEILQRWLKVTNEEVYFLLWHTISAFSTTSFHLPDLRICLLVEIFQFIETEIKKSSYQFKNKRPRCLENFKALKIFVGIMKHKIIPTIINPKQYLGIIINTIQKSQPQEIINQSDNFCEDSANQQLPFPPSFNSRSKKSSTIYSTNQIQQLCPPEWEPYLIEMQQPKFKGPKLTYELELRNHVQDLLNKIKKHQQYRKLKISEKSYYYEKFQLAIKIIFSCLRGCKYVNSKLIGIELLCLLCKQSPDSIKIRLLHPYLISLMEDSDLSVAKYSFHCFVDSFYWFIDPFQSEQDTKNYSLFIQTLINKIKSSKIRVSVFERLRDIYDICEWMELHCKKFSKVPKLNVKNIIQVIKQSYGSFSTNQITMLMNHLPDIMIPQVITFCISYLNTEKMLGFKLSNKIAEKIDGQVHKKIMSTIDSCIESGLDESSAALKYSIKYFTIRKITTKNIVRKICPLIIHPHLWIRDEAMKYVQMCLEDFPPTKVFFLFRQVFQPPFPLLLKDIADNVLLPKILLDSEVDFKQKRLTESLARNKGITQKLFEEYLKKTKDIKGDIRGYPFTKSTEIEDWNAKTKNYRQLKDNKTETIDFRLEIKSIIYELYETNFLFYVGIMNNKFNPSEKEKGYEQLIETCKRYSKFSLEQLTVKHQKKVFFESLLTIINNNFEKLLKKTNKEFSCDKLKIVNCIYLIPSTIIKFDQFQIQNSLKLGDYYRKPTQFQKIQKPKGILVSQIFQHKANINCLEKIADVFFISGSSDGTVKVFNSKKIQTNIITDSEATYDFKLDSSNHEIPKVTSICAFNNTYSIAAATNKGIVKIIQIQRMPSMNENSKPSKSKQAQIRQYNIGIQIQKISTFNSEFNNQCFCYVTSDGYLGIQDLRMKQKATNYDIGKERGLPRALCVSVTDQSLLVGTIDGYLLTYDIRCNIISQVLQLHIESQPTPILSIQPAPLKQIDKHQLYMVTYPSKYYQFSYFNIGEEKQQFHPQKHFTSGGTEILATPYMVNKTKEQNFKLCNNTLTHKITYRNMKNFNKTFNILDYLSDPMTQREAKTKAMWMDACRHRYNQITSIYNKKSLPFVEVLNSSLLTNLNPTISNTQPNNVQQTKTQKKLPFTLLIQKQKKQYSNRDVSQIQRYLVEKPNTFKTYVFPNQQSPDYLTSCKALPNFIVAGCRNSVIKIYK